MSPRASAEERLDRILRLLPAATRATESEGGASASELARELDVVEEDVLEDLREVAERAFYLPAGLGDDIQITFEGERVSVRTTGEFRRPVRLTPAEAAALGVGLRRLAATTRDRDPAAPRRLARGLERELASMPPEALAGGAEGRGDGSRRPGAGQTPEELGPALSDRLAVEGPTGTDAEVFGALERGIREGFVCRLRYLKPGPRGPETRHLAPYELAYAEGRRYVVGHSRRPDDVRIFRLDRVLEASLTGESFEPPEDFDLDLYLSDGRLYRAEEDVEAVVRYSPRIARWIRERWEGEERADGGFVVRHRVADPAWFVRHVLRYGPEAEVLNPPELRAAVRDAARRVADAR